MTASDGFITLAGGTIRHGDVIALDGEYCGVLKVFSATQASVQRGTNGSTAAAHEAGVVAVIGEKWEVLTGPQIVPPFGVTDYVLTGNGPGSGATFQPSAYVVGGDLQVLGHSAFGPQGVIDEMSITYPGNTFSIIANFAEEFSTDLSALDYVIGTVNQVVIDAPSANATTLWYGTSVNIRTKDANTEDVGILIGIYGESIHAGVGTVERLVGLDAWATNDSTGSVTNIFGIEVEGWGNEGGGGSVVTNAAGLLIAAPLADASSLVTTAYGIYIEDMNVTGITNKAVFKYAGTGAFAIDELSNLTSGGNVTAATIQPTTAFKSVDGTAGATAGPFTVITGITVKNGLVTALTGS